MDVPFRNTRTNNRVSAVVQVACDHVRTTTLALLLYSQYLQRCELQEMWEYLYIYQVHTVRYSTCTYARIGDDNRAVSRQAMSVVNHDVIEWFGDVGWEVARQAETTRVFRSADFGFLGRI